MKINHETLNNLKNHQQQLDADGIMVGVSRRALEELMQWIESAEISFKKRMTELKNNLDYLQRHNLQRLAKETEYAIAILSDLDMST